MTTVKKTTQLPFSIRLDKDLKIKLDKEARMEDRTSSYLAQKAIEDFLNKREYKRSLINFSYEEAKTQNKFISDESMLSWVESWDTEEVSEPQPDVFKQ